MPTYTMTETETKGWESEDARTMDAARREIRAKARTLLPASTLPTGKLIEIVSHDGIVMDVVER